LIKFFAIPFAFVCPAAVVSAMNKMMIEMSPEHYDGLLSKLPMESPAHSVLTNGIVDSQSKDTAGRRVIVILCVFPEVEILLGVAFELWPKAALEIKDSILKGT
jgi:hypothetical protein